MKKIANSPEELNQILNEFDWSCIVDTKKVEDCKDNWLKYRTLSANQFLSLKAGCCWDYCNFQASYFDKYFPELLYSLYIIFDSNEGNHTFMIYRKEDKIKLFESSYKEFCGIYDFKEESEVFKFYLDRMDLIGSICIYQYFKPNKDNLSAEEFMNYIYSEGIPLDLSSSYLNY